MPADQSDVSSLPVRLQEHLAQVYAKPERDWEQAIDELCHRHPQHEPALRNWLDAARQVERQMQIAEPPWPTEGSGPGHRQEPHPTQIDRYRILGVLGEGGMGAVYKAEQRDPVRRLVALKIIKLGMDTKDVLARFGFERRALAAMSHSAIAKVFDGGTTERGQPYFVMELVHGVPLTEYCDRHSLSLEERIELFCQICAGVHHAHQKGVIHRDLKPGNILVSREADKPVPKVMDFGLAKATNRELLAQTIYTEQERMLGTPEYMAPEQATGDSHVIDTRADIYSLGVILYEMLCGALPFSSAQLRRAGWLELHRVLAEEEPAKPSTRATRGGDRAAQLAHQRGTTQRGLAKRLHGDLDWIVLKAMAKEPERRYESTTALAADLRRHLGHEPVLAGPPSPAYRFRKLLRRYRGQVMAGIAIVVVLIAGIAAFAMENQRARASERRAKASARQALENLARFELVAHAVRLERAQLAAAELYPAWPDRADHLQQWLDEQAQPLQANLPALKRQLLELRSRADGPQKGSDGPPVFFDETEQFLYDTLVELLEAARRFADPDRGEIAVVKRRLDWARRVQELTVDRFRARWDRARADLAAADGVVASRLYAEHPIDLQPQMGLVPIGANPATKLWEFYHLRSAWMPGGNTAPEDVEIPAHAPVTGHITVDDATGIVFVLLPGGTFTMGSQNEDPDGPNYDPLHEPNETLGEKTVQPFFLARHELTQGQWLRLSGGANPSYRLPGDLFDGMDAPVTLAHPVEHASWLMCRGLLRQHQLMMPAEAEWEYACRATSTTPWWPGAEPDLEGVANVFDQRGHEHSPWPHEPASWDDGFVIHAPVGSLAPNAFGLFDMHGNVWEWCADTYAESSRAVYRGGSFYHAARFARTAHRGTNAPSLEDMSLGVRAARRVLR